MAGPLFILSELTTIRHPSFIIVYLCITRMQTVNELEILLLQQLQLGYSSNAI